MTDGMESKPEARREAKRELEREQAQRMQALETDLRKVEAERDLMEKRRKGIHVSYWIILALVLAAGLIFVPRLQRSAYLKGYSEGERSSAGTEQRQEPQSSENAALPTGEQTESLPAESRPADAYIGNARSKRFHLPTCSGLPSERNRVFFESREEAVEEGYVPCSICQP